MTDSAQMREMMVDCQIRPSDVTKYPIIAAFLEVPREAFLPNALRDVAYAESCLDVGAGAFVLEPRAFAKLLDALFIEAGDSVLDIGAAQGFSTAILSRMSEFVVGVTQTAELAKEGQEAMAQLGYDNAVLIEGDLTGGAPKNAPFDVIIVQGSVETIPDSLVNQLAEHGRIGAFFHENGVCVARVGIKRDGTVYWTDRFEASAPILREFQKQDAFEF